jgi:hypothetical protein
MTNGALNGATDGQREWLTGSAITVCDWALMDAVDAVAESTFVGLAGLIETSPHDAAASVAASAHDRQRERMWTPE